MIRTALRGAMLVFLLLASAWAQEAAVTRRATELRETPSDAGRSMAPLPAQAAVTRLEQRQGPWVQVRTAAGATGWVHLFDLGPATATAASSSGGGDVVGGALRSVGSLFGGGGPRQAQTSTTAGIRGLGAEDLAQSQPDLNAVKQMDALRPSDADVRSFADRSAWKPTAVEPLPAAPMVRSSAPARNPGQSEMP
ncbi:SH3 domain-containing protein [Ramlibacter sp. USB13]|uniref:SH3 domain-containing protein n=1 Tax=Ramlibacter cellulosilyticus TaxID=2764187 RepID=A0A923MMB7_9BURK|nr:SH3 domain-containing protein [Ramlibacter cellulosilyticus]MBC5781665.1 SH3 domain-containing protein [Ramlibacter cellulosilyticus]